MCAVKHTKRANVQASKPVMSTAYKIDRIDVLSFKNRVDTDWLAVLLPLKCNHEI